jgi:hypothetical protein
VPYVRVQQLEKSIIWRFGEPKLIKFQRKRKFRIVTSKEKKHTVSRVTVPLRALSLWNGTEMMDHDNNVKVSDGILLVRTNSGTSKIERVLVHTRAGKGKSFVKW